jgi:transcriptional regulator
MRATMYLPALFRSDDRELACELMERHSFATLMCVSEGELHVAHAPLILDRDTWRLRGHLARANPVAKLLPRLLTIEFKGPDAYVSPTWYEKRSEQVPTWNYAVVHVKGEAVAQSEEDLRTLLSDLSSRYEADWRPSELEPEFLSRLLQEIVGFSIPIRSCETKLKLSQNRSPEDRRRVKEAHETAAPALARLMKRIECGTPGRP